jgi:hypothetical protein
MSAVDFVIVFSVDLAAQLHDNFLPHTLSIRSKPRGKTIGQLGLDDSVQLFLGHVLLFAASFTDDC